MCALTGLRGASYPSVVLGASRPAAVLDGSQHGILRFTWKNTKSCRPCPSNVSPCLCIRLVFCAKPMRDDNCLKEAMRGNTWKITLALT